MGQPPCGVVLYWLERAQDTTVVPEVKRLDSLAGPKLTWRCEARSSNETPGTKLHRTTYHYWFHLGDGRSGSAGPMAQQTAPATGEV